MEKLEIWISLFKDEFEKLTQFTIEIEFINQI